MMRNLYRASKMWLPWRDELWNTKVVQHMRYLPGIAGYGDKQ